MSAYVIVEIDVTDPERYEEYKKLSTRALDACGGSFLVRGGTAETLEGSWSPSRVVVLKFDSVESAKRWWSSEEYRVAKGIRQATARTQMIVVEGV